MGTKMRFTTVGSLAGRHRWVCHVCVLSLAKHNSDRGSMTKDHRSSIIDAQDSIEPHSRVTPLTFYASYLRTTAVT